MPLGLRVPFRTSHCDIIIQIKICAKYRDMLPRPRLVCQGPGLRPIGIHFLFLLFIPLWVWLGTMQDCHHAQCPLPLSIVIRMRLAIRQSKLPACLAEVQLALKILSCIYATGLVKLTDKMDKIYINGKFKVQEPREWRVFFAYLWVTLLYFSQGSWIDSCSVGIRSSQFVSLRWQCCLSVTIATSEWWPDNGLKL